MTPRALIETNDKAGLIHLVVFPDCMGMLKAMFKERPGLEADKLTDGEQALNCITCILHKANDVNARPALATEDEQAEAEFLFPAPEAGLEELFVQCPALALATSLNAGYFPCQTSERFEFPK